MNTKLGVSRRHYVSRVKSAWEEDLMGPIKEARKQKPDRLLSYLRSYRPLSAKDYEALADLIEEKCREVGAPPDRFVHAAAELVRVAKAVYGRPRVPSRVEIIMIEDACQTIEKESGHDIERESVRNSLRRAKPKSAKNR